jgi:SAM-dependent methyltransferase
MGDAVLTFGAYGAQLAGELDALFGIDAHVVVDVAKPASLPSNAVAFADDVKAYEPGLLFDTILALHVAQQWSDPLGTLLHLRKLLKPSGALVVEVPNVLPGGEFEIEAFLGPGTASSFSLNTIRLLLLRAGYHVEVARDDDTVVLSCRIDGTVNKSIPVPFRPDMLHTVEQNGDWLLPRLATYVAAEHTRDEVVGGNTDAATTRAFLELLRQPAFDDHLVNIAVEIVQAYAEAGSFHAARMIAGAAAVTLPEQYRDALRRLTDALG